MTDLRNDSVTLTRYEIRNKWKICDHVNHSFTQEKYSSPVVFPNSSVLLRRGHDDGDSLQRAMAERKAINAICYSHSYFLLVRGYSNVKHLPVICRLPHLAMFG